MIKAEASIAERIRAIFGDKVVVIVGPWTPSSTAWAKPEIYVQLSRFDDWEGVSLEGARTARRPHPNGTPGYVEERPGRIVLEIEISATAYAHVQGMRETLVAPVLLHLESIEQMILSTGNGGKAQIVFRDFVPVLDHFAIVARADGDDVLYTGTVRFNFDGFTHIRMDESVPGGRPVIRGKKVIRKVKKKGSAGKVRSKKKPA